jgi:hypothetical protein
MSRMKRKTISGKLVLALLLPALGIYFLMIFVTLAHLSVLAGGQRVFDMMPAGYGLSYAGDLLESLGEEGRRYYLTRQIPLDFIYPPLFAASFCALSNWLTLRITRYAIFFRRIGYLPIVAGAFDYIENGLIVLMLRSYPSLSPTLVQWASGASLAKSAVTTLFFVLLLAGLLWALASTLLRRGRMNRK